MHRYKACSKKMGFAATILLILIAVQTPYELKGQNNVLFVDEHNMLWAYTNTSIPQSPFKDFSIAFSYSGMRATFTIETSSASQNVISVANLTINIIGGERIHYLYTSFVENNTVKKLVENAEGNIAIEKGIILVQWHKHEVVMLGKFNETHVWIPFKQPLVELLNNVSINPGKVIADASGVYVAEATQDNLRSIYYLFDVYVNKSKYLRLYIGPSQNCAILDSLPMRTDINIGLKMRGYVNTYIMSVDGSMPSDIVNGYKATLCVLPLLIKLQDMIQYIEANITQTNIHSFASFNLFLTSVIPVFLRNITNSLINSYANAVSVPYLRGQSNVIVVSLYNYSSSKMALAIYNMNSTNDMNYKEILCNLSNYTIASFVNQNICGEISNAVVIVRHSNITTPPAVQGISMDTFLALFMLIIAIVAVETGIVIYMTLKIMKHKK
ncbi:MAG: hypothetical protein QXD38_01775 [Ignisphaera sp.]